MWLTLYLFVDIKLIISEYYRYTINLKLSDHNVPLPVY